MSQAERIDALLGGVTVMPVVVLERARDQALVLTTPERFTPLAFPLWVERLRNRLSTESWRDRVARMTERLEKHADRRAGDA